MANRKLTVDEVSLFFNNILGKAKTKLIRNLKQVEKLADEVATGKTIHGAWVFNKVYQTARVPQQVFHTTCWRDRQIEKKHLKALELSIKSLTKHKIPVYKMWLVSGSGSQEKFWEIIFTKKGSPLALTAVIMMRPIFTKPKTINGRYFAVPELGDISPLKEPFCFLSVSAEGLANIFVGGSDYPGEIYKPICKAHNGWVYDLDGFEIHGAAYLANYVNTNGQMEKTLVVISGLSLHGKSALSSKDGVQPAFLVGESTLKEVQFLGIHDDYVAFLPLDIQKKWEVFSYAPQGLFPATHGEKPDAPLIADPRVALFSTFVDKNGQPDFTAKINNTDNQRAASPIDTLEVFRRGKRIIRDFEKVVIIILTRNNFCPSGIIFISPVDFAYSYAGVVVQKTDAVDGDFPPVYYNFACTDFDVVERPLYLRRLVESFANFGRPVTLAMINTGAPGPEESMRVRDAIVAGYAKTEFDKNLGVEVIKKVPGFDNLYLPWKQGGYSYKKTVKEWQKQQKERREFMKKNYCDPKKVEKLIGRPKALV